MFILKGNTPRWIIFTIDILICAFSIVLSYLLRFNFTIPEHSYHDIKYVTTFMLAIRICSFAIGKTYAGIIRYTSSKDAQRIFVVITIGTLMFPLTNLLTYHFRGFYFIPFSVIIIDYMATVFLMIASRTIVKVVYFELKNPSRQKTNVIIYGAGEAGIIAKRTLDRDAGTKYKVLAFIDDDPRKAGKKLEGIDIYPYSKLEELLQGNTVAHVIISIQEMSTAKKQEIVEKCFAFNTKVLNVPPVATWINGALSFKQIKKINIEELLEREPIKLDTEKIRRQVSDKVVLVTGAAGSIGSEIVRQLTRFNPKKVILLDQAESPLYEIEMELLERKSGSKIEVVMGDIRNAERMDNMFRTFMPEVVYHAAAYKHVPMMENNPSEAIRTNVLGTKNMADLSVKYKVKDFVMVSTDKAVNPTNVMGASKRIAEIYIQSLNKASDTHFITTRFGNVLGSNGSVIPRFKKQIDKGGPITITHPDITRYFMTIPEACQLVLEAGSMGQGGEIFIFDMGKSVKIVDLARKMIRLSGLTIDKDIQIVYTGLRPGEKLYEELLNDTENTLPTHHSQIMIAKVATYDVADVAKNIDELVALFDEQDNEKIVTKMKLIVPEFKSNNSVFEKLDTPA
jgi:FlaA1/EpsC-like NDP-sugar epimerase